MFEPSLPGAADRLSPNDPSGLQRRLTAILQSSPAPTVCVAQSRDDGGDLMVAGTSLLEQVRHRVGALQRAGMRRGDVLASDAVGVGRVVDSLAAIIGGFVYWPCDDFRRIVSGPLVSDSGASLVWRPNPLVGAGNPATMPHEPPAALPMRLSVQLRAQMQPAGPQIRLLVDGNGELHPSRSTHKRSVVSAARFDADSASSSRAYATVPRPHSRPSVCCSICCRASRHVR